MWKEGRGEEWRGGKVRQDEEENEERKGQRRRNLILIFPFLERLQMEGQKRMWREEKKDDGEHEGGTKKREDKMGGELR